MNKHEFPQKHSNSEAKIGNSDNKSIIKKGGVTNNFEVEIYTPNCKGINLNVDKEKLNEYTNPYFNNNEVGVDMKQAKQNYSPQIYVSSFDN